MNSKSTWIGAAALVALVAGLILWSSRGEAPQPAGATGTERAPESPASAARPSAAAPLAAPTDRASPAPDGGSGRAVAIAAPASPMRTLPYRPAKLLIFSEGEVSQDPSEDGRAPVLQRLIAVIEATPQQASQIRSLWSEHEEGRRRLWAAAYDRKSGPRMLPEAEVAKLDQAFESGLFDQVLQPAQVNRLLEEMGRPVR